jgi:hypothetical protein
LLDGLESASGDVSRGEIDKLISTLGKRVFIQHNVHAKQPALFQTRWAMNFLAGPLSRNQIPALNKLVGADFLKVTPDLADSTPQTATNFRVQPASMAPDGSARDGSSPAPVMAAVPVPQPAPSKPSPSILGI